MYERENILRIRVFVTARQGPIYISYIVNLLR